MKKTELVMQTMKAHTNDWMKSAAKRLMMIASIAMLIAVLGACGSSDANEGKSSVTPPPAASENESSNETSKEPERASEPAVITFYSTINNVQVESFMEEYGNAIEEKFPHVTVNFITKTGEMETSELIVTGRKWI